MLNFNYKLFISKFLFIALMVGAANAVFAQTKQDETNQQLTIPEVTEFTYQGRLVDNNQPANGTYDFQFRLTDGTNDPNLVIGTQQRLGVQVVNGIFTVRLDFGRNFPAGAQRFLEIGVKPANIVAYTTLSPLQPITATPFAVHSTDASFATFSGDSNKLGGMTADQFVLTGDARLSDDRNPLPGSSSYIQNTSAPQSANFNVTGDGTIGGNLTVGGTTSFNVVNAQTQYNFGGQRFLSGNAQNGNLFAGFNAGNLNATGGGNSFFGYTAGTNNVAGVANSFFGSSAGTSNTSGGANSFFGADAGRLNTTGNFNTTFGYRAGEKNLTGVGNTLVGAEAGRANLGNGNSFFGLSAGMNNTTGNENSFFGDSAGRLSTTGIENAFFGYVSGNGNTTGSSNATIGAYAGYLNAGGNQNAFVGARSGFNSTGSNNAFFGYQAGLANTTGSSNTALGAGANFGTNNLTFATAIGAGAVVSQNNTIALGRNDGSDTVFVPGTLSIGGAFNVATQYNIGGSRVLSIGGTNNTFAGLGTGSGNTTGIDNAFFGASAGFTNSTGGSNAFFGSGAGYSNANGNQNAFFGFQSGSSNNSGSYNAFFGTGAGAANTTGSGNVFIGQNAGIVNTVGGSNTALGAGADVGAGNLTNATALGAGTIVNSSNTIALGRNSGADTVFVPGNLTVGGTTSFSILNAQTQYNLGGQRVFSGDAQTGNVFAGFNAGITTTGYGNSFFGSGAGSANTIGTENSFFGSLAGAYTTGSSNTFFGQRSGISNTTGSSNVFVGNEAGSANATGSNNTALGAGANFIGFNLKYATAVGAGATVDKDETIVLGRSNGFDSVEIPGSLRLSKYARLNQLFVISSASFLNLPVAAGTTNVCLTDSGTLVLCSSSIRYKTNVENFTGGLELIKKLRPVTFDWKDGGKHDLGFIAEEVNAVEPLMTIYNKDGQVEGVKYDRISTALVNAVNEQQTEIETQRTETDAQKKQIEEQKTLIQDQQRQLNEQQKQLEALKKIVCAQNAKAEICEEKK